MGDRARVIVSRYCNAGTTLAHGREGHGGDVPRAAQTIYRFELIAGAILSIAAAPVVLIAAGAIAVLSRRSPFVAHLRVGLGGAPFWMWKLRTMWNRSDVSARRLALVERIHGSDVPECKRRTDPRITSRFARFCRRYSIDELPQLLHVAAGQMSLVGPRPITRGELDRFYGPVAREVLSLRPGITGLWQISGRSTLSYKRRRELDVQLVRRFSAKLYVSILLKSIPKILSAADSY
jgi:exopolysaccharide production protein ExoY